MPSRSSHSIGEDVRQIALKYTQGSHSSKCLVNMFVTNKASIGTCLGIRLGIVREKEVLRMVLKFLVYVPIGRLCC